MKKKWFVALYKVHFKKVEKKPNVFCYRLVKSVKVVCIDVMSVITTFGLLYTGIFVNQLQPCRANILYIIPKLKVCAPNKYSRVYSPSVTEFLINIGFVFV